MTDAKKTIQTDPEDNINLSEEAQNADSANASGTEYFLDTEDDLAMPDLNADNLVSALQTELAETKDKMVRALADAENTRRRAMKDREDAAAFSISKFAKDLLDYADNFKRAIDSLPEGTPDGVVTGLQAMETDMINVFKRHGIEKIEPLDQQFDAHFHEVMFEAPMPDKLPGTIIQVIEPGYIIKDRLLRAAKVGIAKGDDTAQPSTPIDQEV